MNPLDKRSSVVSNFAAGILGWVSFIAVGLLTHGYMGSPLPLYLAVASGVLQVLVMRLLFKALRMNKSLWYGSAWGFLFGLGYFFLHRQWLTFLDENVPMWLFLYLFIGTALGWYLSYFHIDDKSINSKHNPEQSNYGRDAHWYEPFIFGAVIYSIVFFEVGLERIIYCFLVGAVTGIVSAAASHFSPDKWKFSVVHMLLTVIITGTIIGLPSGLIFWKYESQLSFEPALMGTVAGILTFLVTFMRGKQLARREKNLTA